MLQEVEPLLSWHSNADEMQMVKSYTLTETCIHTKKQNRKYNHEYLKE